jgi:hypothetical protein
MNAEQLLCHFTRANNYESTGFNRHSYFFLNQPL